jgi:hypothetical protein
MEPLSYVHRKDTVPLKCSLVAATVVSLSLVGLTGCASEDGQAALQPNSVQASTTPSGPVMTVEEAGKTYLKLSDASNAAREAWMRAPRPTVANLGQHKQLATRAVDATVAFSRGLRAHRWPSQAQPYVDALDKHLQQRAAAYQRVADAGTLAEYLTAAGQVPVTSTLTGKVRQALSLPEAPVVEGATPR